MGEDEDYNVQNDLNEILDKATADRVKEMRHGESLLTQGKQGYQSVLKIMATAVGNTDKEYRQALLLASFFDIDEANRCTAALSECKRYGVDITPIVDRIIARCAVRNATGGRIQSLVDALTHQRITTNTTPDYKKAMDSKNKNSPLGNG